MSQVVQCPSVISNAIKEKSGHQMEHEEKPIEFLILTFQIHIQFTETEFNDFKTVFIFKL